MRQLLKRLIVYQLERRVVKLRERNTFTVVAVVGSIGKTSTKLAIAQLLGAGKRVQYQEGNYNVDVTVPLVFFGLPIPSLMNPLAWAKTFIKIDAMLRRPYPYDVVVVELGTDMPGQLAKFGYVRPDIGVLTAITAEHMEFFNTLKAVAQEETAIAEYAKRVLVNVDLCPAEYVPQAAGLVRYGSTAGADYSLQSIVLGAGGYSCTIQKKDQTLLELQTSSISKAQLYSLTAAVAVADMIGVSPELIQQGMGALKPVKGRLQLLRGIDDSTIIDDTYNASPEAVKAALQTLYDMPGQSRIALLGNMNELGDYSVSSHAEIGGLCDPKRLTAVVTLGPDANEFLAAAAEKRGCTVRRSDSPYEAAQHIRELIKPGTVILAKGSQNRVFAEEAVKALLADPADTEKLVRQTPYWMKIKRSQFGDPS